MYKKNKIFSTMVFSYLSILLIPLMIGILLYNYVINIIEINTLESNRHILNQAVERLERELVSIDKKVRKVAIDNNFKTLWMKKFSHTGELNYSLYELSKEVNKENLIDELVIYYYIYFIDLGVVIAPSSVYMNEESFYNTDFNYQHISIEQWKTFVNKNYFYQKTLPSSNIKIRGSEQKGIGYIQSIPIDPLIKQPKAQMVLIIDEQAIRQMLTGIVGGEKGSFIVSDYDKQAIFQSGEVAGEILKIPEESRELAVDKGVIEISINGEETFLFANRLEQMGWIIYSTVPKSAVLQSMGTFKMFVYSMLVLVIILGGVGYLIWSYKGSKPLMKILIKINQNIEMDKKDSNYYKVIEHAVDYLVDDTEKLQKRIEEQVLLMKNNFIQNLVLGNFLSNKEIEEIKAQLNIEFLYKYYKVIIIEAKLQEDISTLLYNFNRYKDKLGEYLKLVKESSYYWYQINQGKLVLLFNHEKDTSELNAYLESSIHQLEVEGKFGFWVGLGNSYEQLLEIYKSYNEAQYVLVSYNQSNKENTITYTSQGNIDGIFYYPLELENRLINLILSGNQEASEETLDKIYEENLKLRELSSGMQKQLKEEIYGTLMKVQNKTPLLKEISIEQVEQLKEESIQIFMQEVKHLTKVYCSKISEEKANQYSGLVQNVVEYIEKNYMKYELSLELVSSEFGFSSNYFSNLFKKHIGDTFASYLARIRMEKACNLLLEGKLTINEVSLAVGYSSDQSFRRAFKRIVGCGPSEYKRMHK